MVINTWAHFSSDLIKTDFIRYEYSNSQVSYKVCNEVCFSFILISENIFKDSKYVLKRLCEVCAIKVINTERIYLRLCKCDISEIYTVSSRLG